MLRSNRLIQSYLVSKYLGGDSSLSIEVAKKQAPPDPSKVLHYSTMGVAACLPATMLLPVSGLTLVADCMLGVFLPTHMFFGLKVVIDNYICKPLARKTYYGGALGVSGLISLGILAVSFKHGSLGTAIQQLWTK